MIGNNTSHGYINLMLILGHIVSYSSTSVSIVYSPIPADYTKLTSFGAGKDTIRDYVLPPNKDGIQSTLISENVKGETYTAEYTVSTPDAPKRHVISVFALRPQEAVVGLTIQSTEVRENRDLRL